MELTLENILFELRKEGVLNKNKMLAKLENATIEDLMNLKYSIQKRVNIMIMEGDRE